MISKNDRFQLNNNLATKTKNSISNNKVNNTNTTNNNTNNVKLRLTSNNDKNEKSFGSNFSIVCNTHRARMSKLNIEKSIKTYNKKLKNI
jgi:hypothetical protein